MANIVRVRAEIVGIRPLIQHAFGPHAIPLEKQERTGVAGNDPEEWKRSCLVTPDGALFIRGTYVFGCMRDAAKHTKRGRGSLQSSVAATLQVEEEVITLDRKLPPEGTLTQDRSKDVYLDVTGVRNPATKARNVRYRLACAKGWKCSFTLLFDKTVVATEQMRSIMNDGGMLVGLADGRAVGYGRFSVTSFSVLNGENPA